MHTSKIVIFFRFFSFSRECAGRRLLAGGADESQLGGFLVTVWLAKVKGCQKLASKPIVGGEDKRERKSRMKEGEVIRERGDERELKYFQNECTGLNPKYIAVQVFLEKFSILNFKL